MRGGLEVTEQNLTDAMRYLSLSLGRSSDTGDLASSARSLSGVARPNGSNEMAAEPKQVKREKRRNGTWALMEARLSLAPEEEEGVS